jgi:tartrate dehydrogenase/decarboxylase/D-malate dehydrogenase
MKTYKIAAVNGDGVGHEIVPAGMQLIEAVAHQPGVNLVSETLL